ncbi:hypothetical protein JW978_01365 [Candidatus Dojkabacteria bacterium]|nr:hypothetical protein [Candidatus Dojkabacteria bacterium]
MVKKAEKINKATLKDKLGEPEINKTDEIQEAEEVEQQDEKQDEKQDELPPLEEEQPIQKVVEKQKPRGKSWIKCNCQTCSCFGCLMIILFIIFIGLSIYFRPPFLLNPLKKYVNQGYAPQGYENVSVVDINEAIALSLTKTGEAAITEGQLESLMSEQLKTDNVFVDIEPSTIRVVTDMDENSTVPLYLFIEISHTSDDKMLITKLGFQRYGAPKFIRNLLTDSAFAMLDTTMADGDDEGTQFINSFINQDNEGDIAGVRFEKDQIVIFEK